MKQNQVYISIPVNISRNVMVKARELCPNSQLMSSEKKHTLSDLYYLDMIKEGRFDEMPDIMVTIRPEFHWQKDERIYSQAFDDKYRYEVNTDLQRELIVDKNWILKPIFIMPIVIFYNSDMENPPQSWRDLLDEKYKGKIATTDEATPPVHLLKRFFKDTYADKGAEVVENHIDYLGAPIDVNRAVTNKEYEIGIVSLSFAMFSKNNAVKVCWPKEGALYLTQVMLMKKGYSEDSKKVADYLLSYDAQKMFSEGAGFIPVRSDVVAPKLYIENNRQLLDFPE